MSLPEEDLAARGRSIFERLRQERDPEDGEASPQADEAANAETVGEAEPDTVQPDESAGGHDAPLAPVSADTARGTAPPTVPEIEPGDQPDAAFASDTGVEPEREGMATAPLDSQPAVESSPPFEPEDVTAEPEPGFEPEGVVTGPGQRFEPESVVTGPGQRFEPEGVVTGPERRSEPEIPPEPGADLGPGPSPGPVSGSSRGPGASPNPMPEPQFEPEAVTESEPRVQPGPDSGGGVDVALDHGPGPSPVPTPTPRFQPGAGSSEPEAVITEAEPVGSGASEPDVDPLRFARPLPRILAIANQKGGVGKTTTTVNLGASLAVLGYRVLVVDLDPQGNATTGLGINSRNLESSIYDVILHDVPLDDCVEASQLRNLFVAPATIDLAGAEIELVPAFSRELRLRRALEEVKSDYDFVLIDCPPSLGLLTVNALSAASEVVVPIQCEYYALEGLGQLLRNVNLVQANLNPTLELSAIVLTMYDGRTKLAEQVADEVRQHFGDKVCRNVVPRTVRLSEAPSFGQPIIVFDPSSRGALAYRELAREVSGGPPQRTG